ncbi:MAG TPA: peroxidase family protein [Actinoplanes sp.]|nr:peroxidase family protein [Actinoplanes sp.]
MSVLFAVSLTPMVAATPAQAAVGQGFHVNPADLRFILRQIQIAEAHAQTASAENPCGTLLGPGPNQIPDEGQQGAELPWGLRTVDGTCNNLLAGQEKFGTADRMFPRMATESFKSAESAAQFGGANPSSYNQTAPGNIVVDSQPRIISNLVADQTADNPAAVAAAGDGATADESGTLPIPNTAPDAGLSAPYNSWFTIFGQFFDHGLDLTNKGGGTVFVPLQPDDPLYDPATPQTNFMVLTRATNAPGTQEAVNQTATFVDQSQTYTSHPSHQVFLRRYEMSTGRPLSTGAMLDGADGGLATWASTKAQAAGMLGIQLTDADVLNVPLLSTDPYGRFIPGPNGFPQIATATGLVEGDPTANGGAGVLVPANAARTGHAFLDDIAHHAVPKPATPAQGPGRPAQPAATPDANTTIDSTAAAGTYDDETLDRHFVAGDGRINENIALSAVHHIFHSEHNRLAGTGAGSVKDVLLTQDPGSLPDWQTSPGVWNGERIFQAAKFITEMEYQHLAFEEFARKVQPMVNLFSGYDSTIDPAITAEFAHAVYRFGHSMLNETVPRVNADGTSNDVSLFEAFLDPVEYTNGGSAGVLTPEAATGSIVRGLTSQVGNELDEFVTDALRNRLVGLPLDLATLNLTRARDTGLPTLNVARREFFAKTGDSALAPYANWNDFGLNLKHRESLINFVAAYGTHPSITAATTVAAKRTAAALLVAGDPANPATPADSVTFMESDASTSGLDNVDLWVGGLAEKQAPFGGLLGSTFNFVFELQMENLQDGDRFYYLTRTAGLNLLVQLEGNSFAEMISRNSDAENLPADVFSRPDYVFDLANLGTSGPVQDDPATPDYDESHLLDRLPNGTIRYGRDTGSTTHAGDLHVLFIGTAANNGISSSEGDDTVRGNDGNDRLEGGAGNDGIIGGLGDDIMTDTFGDDVLKGGDGHDAMSSGAGAGGDLNQGGRGNDFVVGGADITETFGGPGNDFIFGGQSTDTVFGDDGDDWIQGGPQADLLQGDNGAPFQDDPNTPGHDVIVGDGGADDFDAEGGDDIMVAAGGISRSEGVLGFDWTTYKNRAARQCRTGQVAPCGADADLNKAVFVAPAIDTLADRFDLVEGLSGWNLNDTLRGSDNVAADMVGHELDAAGIARINGLSAHVNGATSFTGGDILLGGSGSDTIEGRAGNDVIDGDAWLNVRLSVRTDPNDPATEIRSANSMQELQADVFAGTINPGNIVIVREILTGSGGDDTAVFSDVQANYTVTVSGDVTTVNHTGGTQTDGVDTLRNIENLRFSDGIAAATPAAPTAVTAVAGDTSAVVTFTAPANPGRTAITGFTVEIQTAAGAVLGSQTVPADATQATVLGLTNGTAYRFRVLATNAAGDGPFSALSTAVTPSTVPGTPVIGTATAGNAQATITWTAPVSDGGSPITGYTVERTNGTTVVLANVAATARSFTATGLANGTAYSFRVRAVNAAGAGAFSAGATVTPATVPGVPAIGAATAGNASAVVRWTEPANNGGSAITRYDIQVINNATNAQVGAIRTAAANTTLLTVTGLTNGTAYRFRVRAVNAIGAGGQSGTSNVVTPLTTAGAPQTVTATSGAAGGAITAVYRWTPPTVTGGAPITGYQVTRQRLSAAGANLGAPSVVVHAATARQATFTAPAGVPAGATYRFTVQAVNAAGSGAARSATAVVR